MPTQLRPMIPNPPATRFQGSKLKLLPWIDQHLSAIEFTSVLDGFGGSACVSHFFKGRGKQVTYNDSLVSGYLTAVALVENCGEQLTEMDIATLLATHRDVAYDDLIQRTFKDIYFTDEENAWLDRVVQNIPLLANRFKQAMAFYALFQAALVKRPYNLFHRRNLYMRLADVKRGFGNKTTWDTPFETHFRAFAAEGNRAVFDSGTSCRAINGDVAQADGEYDLVYLDPPYINAAGVGVDYFSFYHFLDGMADYRSWESRIDFKSRHRRLQPRKSAWTSAKENLVALRETMDRFRRSSIAISYRSDGIPTAEDIQRSLKDVKREVQVHTLTSNYQYALSTNARSTELLFIGID